MDQQKERKKIKKPINHHRVKYELKKSLQKLQEKWNPNNVETVSKNVEPVKKINVKKAKELENISSKINNLNNNVKATSLLKKNDRQKKQQSRQQNSNTKVSGSVQHNSNVHRTTGSMFKETDLEDNENFCKELAKSRQQPNNYQQFFTSNSTSISDNGSIDKNRKQIGNFVDTFDSESLDDEEFYPPRKDCDLGNEAEMKDNEDEFSEDDDDFDDDFDDDYDDDDEDDDDDDDFDEDDDFDDDDFEDGDDYVSSSSSQDSNHWYTEEDESDDPLYEPSIDDVRIPAGCSNSQKLNHEDGYNKLFSANSSSALIDISENSSSKYGMDSVEQVVGEAQKQHDELLREYYNMDSKKRPKLDMIKPQVKVVTCQKNELCFDFNDFEGNIKINGKSRDEHCLFDDAAFIFGNAEIITLDNSLRNQYEAKSSEDIIHTETDKNQSHRERPQNNYNEKRIKLNRNLSNSKKRPKFFNSINSRHVLVLLQNELYINGHIHLTLIAGNARVFGYVLPVGKTVDINSPQGYNAIFVEPAPVDTHSISNVNLSQQLSEFKSDFLSHDLEFIQKTFNPKTHALVLMERNRKSTAVHMTERYMKETFIPNIDIFNSKNYYYSSEFILHCRFMLQSPYVLAVNPDWQHIQIKHFSRVFVIGGKGVGKSTCIRYLINSNLSKHEKFLLIDLDIGQPELFLPQTVSATLVSKPILGPGFLQNIQPVKSYFYGDIHVVPSPIKYLECVQKLHAYCLSRKDLSAVPWIFNTMGYTRGLGPELITAILRRCQPTDVIQIQSSRDKDNFDAVLHDSVVNNSRLEIFCRGASMVNQPCSYKTHILSSMLSTDGIYRPTMLAKDIRYAMVLSKLGASLKSTSDWLSSLKPICASISDLKVIVPDQENISPEHYLDLLNASLVYLCSQSNTDDSITCFGIGLVRAINKLTQKLYLVSSLSPEDLVHVNAIALGAIPLPSAVLLHQYGLVRGSIPFVYNTDSFVGSKQVAQHVFKPATNFNVANNIGEE